MHPISAVNYFLKNSQFIMSKNMLFNVNSDSRVRWRLCFQGNIIFYYYFSPMQ